MEQRPFRCGESRWRQDDDGSAAIYPGSDEIVDNDVDEDCDGVAIGGDDPAPTDDDAGCNCATDGGPLAGWALAPLLALVVRRRR